MPNVTTLAEKLRKEGKLYDDQFLLSEEERRRVKDEFSKGDDRTRLSKKDKLSRFSVIKASNGLEEDLFVVYNPNVDNLEPSGPLDKGAHGTIKAAQNLRTGEWVVLKVQRGELGSEEGEEENIQAQAEVKYLGKKSFLKGYQSRIKVKDEKQIKSNYIFMQMMQGVQLKEMPTIMDDMTKKEIYTVYLNILKNMQELKDLGIIHRDLNEGNIIINPKNEYAVNFIDWGSAVDADENGLYVGKWHTKSIGIIPTRNGVDVRLVMDNLRWYMFDNIKDTEVKKDLLSSINAILAQCNMGISELQEDSKTVDLTQAIEILENKMDKLQEPPGPVEIEQRVHPILSNADAVKIQNNESLLSEEDKERVEEIRAMVNEYKERAVVIQLKRDYNELKNTQMLEELNKYRDNILYVEALINEDKDVNQTLNDMLTYIEAGFLSLDANIKNKDDLVKYFNLDEDPPYQDKEAFFEKLIHIQAKNEANCKKLEEDDSVLQVTIDGANDEIEELKREFEGTKIDMPYQFDIDDDFNLVKISKNEEKGPALSVIFAKDNDVIQPYILYAGNEDGGSTSNLAEDEFGTMKLAQNYDSNELVAVKIENCSKMDESMLSKEKEMLKHQGNLKGVIQVQRTNKEYIVQKLQYGKTLRDLIGSEPAAEEIILAILKHAALSLQKLHDDNKIHRNINLENFTWDDKTRACVLNNWLYVESVDEHKIIHKNDQAGAANYLSPELKHGNYSKASDIYAFGILLQEALKKHPQLLDALDNEIKALTRENFNDRPKNLHEVIRKINNLQRPKFEIDEVAGIKRPQPLAHSQSISEKSGKFKPAPTQQEHTPQELKKSKKQKIEK